MPTYAIALLVVAVLAGVFLFVLRKKSPTAIEQDTLSMKEVIAFFKEGEVMQSLKSNSNMVAVAIREKQIDGRLKITLTPYDKQQNTIASNAPIKIYLVKRLDEDLEKNFRDKDMLILQ
ncbi:hypothetical protein [Helicobacter bizzozeronii]|uniref:hypothetical protein n=1 Tax=Helicobacter bizzozeronii TaxID=56877 RepID=UPI000CED8461|nr:hypothetical protein [Helicobacter bizzozeronii]